MKSPPQRTSRQRVGDALTALTYVELRDLSREFRDMATSRADPKEDLGGFNITSNVDWAELLADWAESVQDGC